MCMLRFVLILFLLDKVSPSVLRDLSNPRTPGQVNLNEENVLQRRFLGSSITKKYNNEDSQTSAEELTNQSGREGLTKSPSVYGQYLYNKNVYEHPYQQIPQQKEVVKKNHPYEQILPNQQIEEHIPPNAYWRPVQEIPEEQMRQNYFQQFPQNAPGYLKGFPQNFQQWPLQYNNQQTGTEQYISQSTEPLPNNENQISNKQIAEKYKQYIQTFLQNMYKQSEQDVSQSSFQYGPNLEGRYSGEYFPQNSAGVLYPPNFYQGQIPQQNEEQEGSQRPHMYYSYPPSYDRNNNRPFYGPSATETPVQDQPQRTRHVQTGEITVVKVP